MDWAAVVVVVDVVVLKDRGRQVYVNQRQFDWHPGTRRPGGRSPKKGRENTAKHALDPRATCTTEATSNMLLHLRNSRRQTHDLASSLQLEFCCLSALQNATCDRMQQRPHHLFHGSRVCLGT